MKQAEMRMAIGTKLAQLLVAALLIGGITMLFASAGAAAADPEYKAVKAAKRVVVDGKLDEWVNVQEVPFKGADMVVAGDASTYQGPTDLSARVYVTWDAKNLYIAADVSDDVVLQGYSGAYIFQGDGFQLFLALEEGHKDRSHYGSLDFQFGFTPGTDAKEPSWHLWNNTTFFENLKVRAARTDRGYTLEVAIPWEELGFTPSVGTRIGFDLGMTDADIEGEPQQHYFMLSRAGDAWANPSRFGWLTFAE